MSEQVHPGANLDGEWLTITEAVTYCANAGLLRTPKTIRRWAMRSFREPQDAELVVRREDVDNGFRWSVERKSLDRKIDQELEFEARRDSEPVHTGQDRSTPVYTSLTLEKQNSSEENIPEQAHTRSHPSAPVLSDAELNSEYRERLEEKNRIIEFLQEELRDRRQSTAALTDVITAFRLNAEHQAQQLRIASESSEHNPLGDVGHDGVHE